MNWRHFLGVMLTGGSLAAGCDASTRSSALQVADGAADVEAAAGAGGAGGGGGAGGDEGVGGAAGAADAAANDGPQAEPCICSPTHCCDQHAGAPATVQMGFTCCWGTSC